MSPYGKLVPSISFLKVLNLVHDLVYQNSIAQAQFTHTPGWASAALQPDIINKRFKKNTSEEWRTIFHEMLSEDWTSSSWSRQERARNLGLFYSVCLCFACQHHDSIALHVSESGFVTLSYEQPGGALYERVLWHNRDYRAQLIEAGWAGYFDLLDPVVMLGVEHAIWAGKIKRDTADALLQFILNV